jgi:broad specificity phosphatase PhoE
MSARLFIVTRHAESTVNSTGMLSSDPLRPVDLSARGRYQAYRLGLQLAHVEVEVAVHSRFVRTRLTAELALQGRGIPLLTEPDLDEVRAGVFDGAPIHDYWAWKANHSRTRRFPLGESLDGAARRYAAALARLLDRPERITLVVSHELAVRSIVEAASPLDAARPAGAIPNAAPYLLDEAALRRAAQRLHSLVLPSDLGQKDAA